eukprot:g8364.t1
MTIRVLDSFLVNRIAAGEVVGSVCSVVKELGENALDAQAQTLKIVLRNGGQSLIRFTDDGVGIPKDELSLAIQRHATSKLWEENLFDIGTFGFRGEALPSIASVSRFSIISYPKNQDQGWCLEVEAGQESRLKPVPFQKGTQVDVRDLFYTTPARLKFLKSPKTELTYIQQVLHGFALAHPHVTLTLENDQKTLRHYPAVAKDCLRERLGLVIGEDFARDALDFEAIQDETRVWGYLASPTAHRATASAQYLFVNNRPIKDKVIAQALRQAYEDVIPAGRFPSVVLFIEIPRRDVDVNVHPSKTEVRFRDIQSLRSLIVGGIRRVLKQTSSGSVHHLAERTIHMLDRSKVNVGGGASFSPPPAPFPVAEGGAPLSFFEEAVPFKTEAPEATDDSSEPHTDSPKGWDFEEPPLGHALGQIDQTYILAQNKEGLVIVDQHAAHERIVYEKMKARLDEGPIASQALLIPQTFPFERDVLERVQPHFATLKKLGLGCDCVGNTLIIREEKKSIEKKIPKDQKAEIIHVGSTSVPDLISKPIIDIIVACEDPRRLVNHFKALGYEYKGIFNIPFRHFFTKDQRDENDFAINLHLHEHGNPEIMLNIGFRDYLLKNQDARKEYGELKKMLAQKPESSTRGRQGIANYTLGKESFIRRVLESINFKGLCFRLCTHKGEWAKYREMREREVAKEDLDIGGASDNIYEQEGYFFPILSKCVDIVSIAHLEFPLDARHAILHLIATDLHVQKKGYASHMLTLIEKWVREEGKEALYVRRTLKTQGFFVKRGFQEVTMKRFLLVSSVLAGFSTPNLAYAGEEEGVDGNKVKSVLFDQEEGAWGDTQGGGWGTQSLSSDSDDRYRGGTGEFAQTHEDSLFIIGLGEVDRKEGRLFLKDRQEVRVGEPALIPLLGDCAFAVGDFDSNGHPFARLSVRCLGGKGGTLVGELNSDRNANDSGGSDRGSSGSQEGPGLSVSQSGPVPKFVGQGGLTGGTGLTPGGPNPSSSGSTPSGSPGNSPARDTSSPGLEKK